MVKIIKLPDGPQPSAVTAQLKETKSSVDPYSRGSDIEGSSYDTLVLAYIKRRTKMLEYLRNYRLLDPGRIKLWRILNFKWIKEYKKQYRERNRDIINAYNRQYRQSAKYKEWEAKTRDRRNIKRRERRSSFKETPEQHSKRSRRAANIRWHGRTNIIGSVIS